MPNEIEQEGRWGQVAVAALAQNVATGFAFGSFGTLIMAIEEEFAMGRSQSSLAISLMLVSLALTASVVGRLIERVSLHYIMAGGALLGAVGYGLLSVVQGGGAILAVYGLVLGPAASLLGVLPSMTLATRVVPERLQGRALGMVNLPALVMIVPLVIGWVLQTYSLRIAFQWLAVGQLIMVPLLLLAIDRTARLPVPARAETTGRAPAGLLNRPVFWIITIGAGLVVGGGAMKIAHFVPLVLQQGRDFPEANMLLGLSGGAGLIGSLFFGLLADRLGGAKALIINALLQTVFWSIFLFQLTMPLLVLDAFVVGACGGGVQAALGVLLARLYGPARFSRAYGLLTLTSLPFVFALTPLSSVVFEASGTYDSAIAFIASSFLVAAIMFAFTLRTGDSSDSEELASGEQASASG